VIKCIGLGVCIGLAFGAPDGEAKDRTPEETLAQVERDFADMQITKDDRAIKAIEAIMSDDFYSFDSTTGQRSSKAQLIAGIRSADYIVKSMDFPPFFVRVFGSTAVAQGIYDETAVAQGRQVTGTFAWFDVFEKREDRWVWLVSQSSRVNANILFLCDTSPCPTAQPGFSLKP